MILSRRTLVGLLVSVVFLALVFWRVDLGEVGAAFRSAAYWYLAPAVVVYFAAFWLRAYRWRLLLAHLGPVTVGRAYWVATIGYAANNVLPFRLGEFLRAYLLGRRPGLSPAASLATIAVERILDGLTLLAWLGVSFFILAPSWEIGPTLILVLQLAAFLFIGAGVGLVMVILLPGAALRLIGMFLRPLPARWSGTGLELARAFLSGLEALRRGRMLPFYILLSNAIWVGEAIVYFFVARALDVDASFVVLAAVVAASNLVTSVPSSSGGIGPFELLAKETLVLVGVVPSLAAAYAILIHATLWVPVALVGALLLAIEGVSLREAVRLPRITSSASGVETGE